MTTKKIALFIDADNISAKFGKQIIDELERRGEIFIRRIYGNWEKISLHGWNECILNFSLRAVQQPDFASGKNATDMSLTIDAMDVLYDGKAEVFALVSNDSDFTPLVIRLREGGVNVIGVGNENAAISFRNACHEFIELATESPPEPEIIDVPAEKIQQIHDVLHAATEIHGDAENFVQLNLARQELKNKNFDFTVNDFGYERLRDFVCAFPELYETRQDEDGKNFCYRCLDAESKRRRTIHDILNETALLHEDSAGLVNIWWACDYIVGQKNLPQEIKSLTKSSLIKFVTDSPEIYDTTQQGDDFYYRCRTLKNSVDAGKLQAVHDVLHETATLHGDTAGFTRLNAAGMELKSNNLDIKSMGYGKLLNFLEAFPNFYEISGAGETISYRALKVTSNRTDNLQMIHDVLHETAKAHGDEKGFVNLGFGGNALREKNLKIKDFGHGTLSKFIAAFPNLYELKENSYRCKQHKIF